MESRIQPCRSRLDSKGPSQQSVSERIMQDHFIFLLMPWTLEITGDCHTQTPTSTATAKALENCSSLEIIEGTCRKIHWHRMQPTETKAAASNTTTGLSPIKAQQKGQQLQKARLARALASPSHRLSSDGGSFKGPEQRPRSSQVLSPNACTPYYMIEKSWL